MSTPTFKAWPVLERTGCTVLDISDNGWRVEIEGTRTYARFYLAPGDRAVWASKLRALADEIDPPAPSRVPLPFPSLTESNDINPERKVILQ